MIRRYLSLIIFSLFVSNAIAQDLWISGTAVPGGTQKLTQLADGDYKYAGRLNAGELRIMSTRKAGKQTTYLVATVPDANIVNNGLTYVESKDAKSAAWQVLVSDSQYRFHLNTQHKQLRGEIVLPWGELFIAGGATEVGGRAEAPRRHRRTNQFQVPRSRPLVSQSYSSLSSGYRHPEGQDFPHWWQRHQVGD